MRESRIVFPEVANPYLQSLMIETPKAPDAHADLGRHKFRYAMYPHSGPVGESTVHLAADFNNPLEVRNIVANKMAHAADILETIVVGGPTSIILDVVKRGEDDEDVSVGGIPTRRGRSLILRLYESLGGRARTTLHVTLPVKSVHKTNILEDDLEPLPFKEVEIDGNAKVVIKVELRAFEVQTIRLQL